MPNGSYSDGMTTTPARWASGAELARRGRSRAGRRCRSRPRRRSATAGRAGSCPRPAITPRTCGTAPRTSCIERASTWKPFSYCTLPQDSDERLARDRRRASGGCPVRRVDAVGDAGDVLGVEFESRDQLLDHEAGRRDQPVGLEREPPLDRVDVGGIAERQLPAVPHPFGAVHRRHERHPVDGGERVGGPSGPPVVAVDDVGAPSRRQRSAASSSVELCTPSLVNAWLADAVLATVSTGGSHGRSTAVRSTRRTRPSSRRRCDSTSVIRSAIVSTTTRGRPWRARGRSPSTCAAVPPVARGGKSHDSIEHTHGAAPYRRPDRRADRHVRDRRCGAAVRASRRARLAGDDSTVGRDVQRCSADR